MFDVCFMFPICNLLVDLKNLCGGVKGRWNKGRYVFMSPICNLLVDIKNLCARPKGRWNKGRVA